MGLSTEFSLLLNFHPFFSICLKISAFHFIFNFTLILDSDINLLSCMSSSHYFFNSFCVNVDNYVFLVLAIWFKCVFCFFFGLFGLIFQLRGCYLDYLHWRRLNWGGDQWVGWDLVLSIKELRSMDKFYWASSWSVRFSFHKGTQILLMVMFFPFQSFNIFSSFSDCWCDLQDLKLTWDLLVAQLLFANKIPFCIFGKSYLGIIYS